MAKLRLVIPAVAALALTAALAASGVVAQQSGGASPSPQAAPGEDRSGGQMPGEPRRGEPRGDDRRLDRGGPDDWEGGGDRRSFEDYAGDYPARRWRRDWEDDRPRRRGDDWGDRRSERRRFDSSPGPRASEGDAPRGPMMGPQTMGRMCGPDGGRMIGAMLERLERITSPSENQRAAFDRLKEMAAKAQETIRAACPAGQPPVSPPGRLAAAEKRLEAMLEAIRTVRPALEEFYGSLSEEQKARLYAAGPRPDGREHVRRWRERFGGEGFERRRFEADPREDRREGRQPEGWREDGSDRSYDRGGDRDRRGSGGERWRDRRDDDRDGWPDRWRGRS